MLVSCSGSARSLTTLRTGEWARCGARSVVVMREEAMQ